MKQDISIVVFLIVLVSNLCSQTEITVEKAIDLSINYNLGLKSSSIELEMLEHTKDTRWNVFVPSLSLDASIARDNKKVLIDTASSVESDNWSMSLGIGSTLNLSNSSFSAFQKSLRDYEQGIITWENARDLLTRNVRIAFYDLLVKNESIRIATITLENAEKKYNQDEGYYRRGLISEMVLLKSHLAYETAKSDINSKNLSLETSLTSFRSMLGLSRNESLIIKGSLDTEILNFNAEDLIMKYVFQYRNIQNSRNTIQIHMNTLHELKIQKKDLYLNTFTPTFSASYGIDFKNIFNKPGFSDKGLLRLAVSIPLDSFIPGTKKNNDFYTIDKKIEQQEITLNQALIAAKDDIYIIVTKINNYATSIKTLLLNESIAQRSYDLSYVAWQKGEIDYKMVTDASEALDTAKYKVLSEKYNYHSLLLDLEYMLGIELLIRENLHI